MEKDDIHIDDWSRILFGEAPPLYLLEVVVRVMIVYLMILVAIRLLGKRMSSEVSRADMVSRVCLAAAVGLPIQRPGRGLLVALIIVIVIVIVGKLLEQLVFYKRGAEKGLQGKHAILVKDGVIELMQLKAINMSQDTLFAALRKEGIRHLGQVRRFYVEANGEFSLMKENEEKPGLAVIPAIDRELLHQLQQSDDFICSCCGRKARLDETCECGSQQFLNAIRC